MAIIRRDTFLFRLTGGKAEQIQALFENLPAPVQTISEKLGMSNFSLWTVEDLVFGYYEVTCDYTLTAADLDALKAFIAPVTAYAEILGEPFTKPMRLMYKSLNVIHEDKSEIRHRVFATHLKPGCAEEYKRRHDALSAAAGDTVKDGPSSNFTIWNAGPYILGYCEMVRAFDHEMTEAEKQSSIAWETRGLEIMDWITDDVDWITGQKHPSIRLLLQKA